VSVPNTVPGGGAGTVVVVVEVVVLVEVDVEDDVVVVGGDVDWITFANLFANSSSNQIRFWASTLRPSWG
jgi:hypothetical protein